MRITETEATVGIIVCAIVVAVALLALAGTFIKPRKPRPVASEADTRDVAWWRTSTTLGGTPPKTRSLRVDMPALVVKRPATDVMSPHKDAYVTGVDVIPAVRDLLVNEDVSIHVLPHWGRTCMCDDCATKRFMDNNEDPHTGEWLGATESWSPMDQLADVGDFTTDDESNVIEGVLVETVAMTIGTGGYSLQQLDDMRWAAEFARLDDKLETALRRVEMELIKVMPGIEEQFALVDARYHAAADATSQFMSELVSA